MCLVHEGIDKESGGFGNKRANIDHPNDSIIKIGQNTKKNLGDLRRLPSLKLQWKNHQLMLI